MNFLRTGVALWLAVGLIGCGGSELRPDQQRQYDKLRAEKSSIAQKKGAAQRRADKAFNNLGAAEKRKRMAYKDVVVCGKSADNQIFGSFPWGKKKKAKLVKKGTTKISGKTCKTYRLKVVK